MSASAQAPEAMETGPEPAAGARAGQQPVEAGPKETERDRLDQLAAAVAGSAEALGALSARLARLDGRMALLEGNIDKLMAAHADLAQTNERQTSEIGRLARMGAEIASVRSDVATTLDERREERDQAIKDVRREIDDRSRRQGEDLVQLGNRLDELERVAPRIEALENARPKTDFRLADIEIRLEALAGHRREIDELALRIETALRTRAEAQDGRIEALAAEFGPWRARIEEQSRVLQDARAIAKSVAQEAEALREAHHAATEAQRVFEARVDAGLDEMRRELADEWTAFHARRAAERSRALRVAEERESERDAALAEKLEALTTRIDGLQRESEREREALAGNVNAFRRTLRDALERWRDLLDEAVRETEGGIPTDAKPHLADDHARAVRRAVRARRAGDDGYPEG